MTVTGAPNDNRTGIDISGTHTLYDPRSAYISFGWVSASGAWINGKIGYSHSGRIIAIASSRIFSLRRNLEYCRHGRPAPSLLPYSFNWADLNE